MKNLGYSFGLGGSASNQRVYFIKFSGNSYERWRENFPSKQSDNPAPPFYPERREAKF